MKKKTKFKTIIGKFSITGSFFSVRTLLFVNTDYFPKINSEIETAPWTFNGRNIEVEIIKNISKYRKAIFSCKSLAGLIGEDVQAYPS